MPKEIYIEDGRIINSTDWKEKSEDVIRRLNEDLFDKLTEEDLYGKKMDSYGNVLATWKKTLRKGEFMPALSPSQITTKLNRYLRVYRPMTLEQAQSLSDQDYLDAYGYYLDIISEINKYITYLSDKQTFSAFCNITVDIYDELLQNPSFSQVFSSFEDGFIHDNYATSEAGMVDNKTVINKLQTKNAGHSLVKSPESITVLNTTKIDKVLVNQQLDKFMGMIGHKTNKK